MPDQIRSLNGEDGPVLLVRGDDPAEIHRLAVEWVTDEEDPAWVSVAEDADGIRVESIRAVSWCPYWVCGCGEPGRHYMGTSPGSRGSFRGAFVALHYRTTDEVERAATSATGPSRRGADHGE